MGLKEDVGQLMKDAAKDALAVQHKSGDIVDVSRVLTDRMGVYVDAINNSLIRIVTEIEGLRSANKE